MQITKEELELITLLRANFQNKTHVLEIAELKKIIAALEKENVELQYSNTTLRLYMKYKIDPEKESIDNLGNIIKVGDTNEETKS